MPSRFGLWIHFLVHSTLDPYTDNYWNLELSKHNGQALLGHFECPGDDVGEIMGKT